MSRRIRLWLIIGAFLLVLVVTGLAATLGVSFLTADNETTEAEPIVLETVHRESNDEESGASSVAVDKDFELAGRELLEADFVEADLRGANLTNANVHALGFRSADLGDALLGGLKAEGADFSDASMRGANLFAANLAGALLKDVDLRDANLNGADLARADLSGARLQGAELSGVRWLNTTCPDGTNSEAHGGTCIGHLDPLLDQGTS